MSQHSRSDNGVERDRDNSPRDKRVSGAMKRVVEILREIQDQNESLKRSTQAKLDLIAEEMYALDSLGRGNEATTNISVMSIDSTGSHGPRSPMSTSDKDKIHFYENSSFYARLSRRSFNYKYPKRDKNSMPQIGESNVDEVTMAMRAHTCGP